MDLYQRLENAMDEGMRKSELEHRSRSLFKEIYGDDEKINGREPIFPPIERTLRYSLYTLLYEYHQDLDKLKIERKKRMYGDEKLSKLEIVGEHFGYGLGYIGKGMGLPTIGRALAKGTGHFFETLLCWYALPTVGRRIYDRDQEEEFPSKLLLGSVTLFPALYQARHEDWKYLIIPVATNMLSRIYEGYRRVRDKQK